MNAPEWAIGTADAPWVTVARLSRVTSEGVPEYDDLAKFVTHSDAYAFIAWRKAEGLMPSEQAERDYWQGLERRSRRYSYWDAMKDLFVGRDGVGSAA